MLIEQRVLELKSIIAGNDGRNAVDRSFARAVDELIAAVYDDIEHLTTLPARALFDLFVIKVLYVGRRSHDAAVVDYLGALLDAYLDVRRLFPDDADGRARRLYFSDMLDPERRPADEPNVYDAYRRYADSALFLSGIFSPATRRPLRSRGMLRGPRRQGLDRAYYIATGKTMYRMAAQDHHRGCAHQPETLAKMGANFELYADALREMSETYISGYPTAVLADKMLDAMNAGEPGRAARYLDLLDA
jgi:hypothetical protein